MKSYFNEWLLFLTITNSERLLVRSAIEMNSVRPLTIALALAVAGSLVFTAPSLAQSKKSKKTAKPAKTKAAPAPKFADVEKVFTTNCMPCHSAERHRAGVNLTTYADVMKGNNEGPIVQAGQPEKSFVIKAVRHLPGAAPMPPRAPQIPDAQIKIIEAWIKAGAKEK